MRIFHISEPLSEGHSLKNVEISPLFLVKPCWRMWLRCEPELGGCFYPLLSLAALGPLAPFCMGVGLPCAACGWRSGPPGWVNHSASWGGELCEGQMEASSVEWKALFGSHK